MIDHRNRKKKLIISYKNLTDDIRELFKEAYPDGYKDYLQKTIKPNGEAIFVVPLETDDTSYMIKFDVKIDTGLVDDDLDKDLYGEEEREEGEFAPISEAIDKEEGNDHRVGKLNHGAYEEMFEGLPEDKKEFEMANEDIEDEYGDRPDESGDSYLDGDDDMDPDDDMEPDDDDLLEIEGLLEEADAGEGLLREENPPEERRGRKKKNDTPKEDTKSKKLKKKTTAKQTKAPKEPKAVPRKASSRKTNTKKTTTTNTKATKTTKTAVKPKVTKKK